MYSLIRVWIGRQLARIEIQDSVVVSTTSAADSPSTPSLYWMPKIGIQSACSTYWNVRGRRRQVAARSTSETTQVASANPSATGLARQR